jgi:hypothetical protein
MIASGFLRGQVVSSRFFILGMVETIHLQTVEGEL